MRIHLRLSAIDLEQATLQVLDDKGQVVVWHELLLGDVLVIDSEDIGTPAPFLRRMGWLARILERLFAWVRMAMRLQK